MQFVLVTRPSLRDTNVLFEAACARRGIDCVSVVAGQPMPGLRPVADGARLLYCAGADEASRLLEALLCTPGSHALHDPHFPCDRQGLVLRQHGLPMPRAVFAAATDDATLARQVAWLGGLPVVVKRPGFQGGAGVSRAHSLAELAAQLAGLATRPILEAFVPHARAWRLTVLDGKVLAAGARVPAGEDFRSNGPGSRPLPPMPAPPEADALAIAALRALRLQFGGVDLMEGDDGRLWLAEVNMPCHFADQPLLAAPELPPGVGIADAIVGALLARACS